MKLFRDFGVRALLAVLALVGYEALLIFTVVAFVIEVKDVIVILGMGQTPAMLALGFYFGQRSNGAANP